MNGKDNINRKDHYIIITSGWFCFKTFLNLNNPYISLNFFFSFAADLNIA